MSVHLKNDFLLFKIKYLQTDEFTIDTDAVMTQN